MRPIVALLAVVLLVPFSAHADDGLTPAQIEAMRQKGWITPDFEKASRRLIDAELAAKQAQDDKARLDAQLPVMERKAVEEDGKAGKLKDEINRYAHPDETDFTALQATLKNASAKPEDQMALAQAYVWTYPGGAHTADADKDLQQLQRKIADQAQAAKEADAARTAAQLKLLARVKTHDLTLGEWRAFLQDKSKAEVVQYLGEASYQADDFWGYGGDWTVDPSTTMKAGLGVTFNGGRVQNVAPLPPK